MVMVVILHRFVRHLQIFLAVSIGSNNIVAMILSVARRRVQISLLALFLGLATVMTYRLVWHGGFIWDDDRYVTHNHLLTAPDGLRRIWFSLDAPSQYFPLAYTVLRIERSLWDLQPAGYHWVNIFLHLGNAFLVWRILWRLKVPGAWLAAGIFALHPVQVESVAWISELKNVLMGFFFLLTLLAWVESVDPTNKHRRVFYVAALIFYLLALFAKSTACTLPAALLLILWLKARPIGRRALLEIAPFIVLALGIGLVAVWWEKYHQGTRTLVSLGPIDRLLIASRAVWFYLSKIFWPSDLTFIYPRWQIDARNPVAYLWLVVAGAVAVAIYFGRRVFGRSVEVAALFFVATLSPLLGFIMLYTFRYTFVADHYQYLASIGPIALISAGLTTLSRSFKNVQWPVFGGVVVILVGLSLLSWRQSAMYRDMETLWRTTIARNPGCWMAYNNLGVVQLEKGDIDDAIGKYEQALRFHANYPEAHYNLGSALLQKGKIDDAIQQCEEALQLQPNDPDAHVVLGNAFMAKQDLGRAISQYQQALTLRPEDSNAHYNLAIAFQEKGETEAAAREYEKARRFGAHE
jgi:tetratricopeptide (TPR) repeat protein